MALRLIGTYSGPKGTAKVYRDTICNEYRTVIFDPQGEKTGTSHTDDKQDAISTAWVIVGIEPPQ